MPLSITGIGGQKCSLSGNHRWTVANLKTAIFWQLGVPIKEQQLLLGDRELSPEDILDVSDGSSALVTLLRWRDAAGSAAVEQSAAALQQLFADGVYDPLAKNHLSQTLVFFSVQNKVDAAAVTELLVSRYGVPLNHPDVDNQTAAHYLATTNNLECLRYFTSLGGNLNVQDRNGQTPIFFAASKSGPAMIQALFEAGAEVQIRDYHGKSLMQWARSAENFQALLLCSLRLDPHVLCWTTRPNGEVFAVSLVKTSDVNALGTLEDEFLADHGELLADVLPDATKDQLCEAVGLNANPIQRRNIIKHIAGIGSPVQWTLKCVRMFGFGTGRRTPQIEVVGYCYCYRKENSPNFAVSHLKVARAQQRAGVATLLLSGVVARLDRLSRQGLGWSAFGPGKQLLLSVVEQNAPARALYEKLGFVTRSAALGSPVA